MRILATVLILFGLCPHRALADSVYQHATDLLTANIASMNQIQLSVTALANNPDYLMVAECSRNILSDLRQIIISTESLKRTSIMISDLNDSRTQANFRGIFLSTIPGAIDFNKKMDSIIHERGKLCISRKMDDLTKSLDVSINSLNDNLYEITGDLNKQNSLN